RDMPFDLGETHVLLEDVLDRVDREARSGTADKKSQCLQMPLASKIDVCRQRGDDEVGGQRDDPAARCSSGDTDLARDEVDVSDVDGHELTDPNARGEEQFENEIVADGA